MKYIWLILSQSQYFFFSFFWFILNVNYILMQSWYYFCWLIIFLPFVNLLINQFTSTLAHHLAKNVWIFFLLHFFSSRRKLIFFFLNKKIFYTFFFCLLYTQRLLFTVMVNEQTVSGKISIDRSMMAALLSTIPWQQFKSSTDYSILNCSVFYYFWIISD